jgi:hypothetical protein
MSVSHEIRHALAVLKAADTATIARRAGLEPATVEAALADAAASGRAVEAGGRWTLTPLARLALEADYSRVHADLRADSEFAAANAEFEALNRDLKATMTDWQTVTVAGERLPNDHRDPAYDARILDRLGRLHARAEPLLRRLEADLPRVARYRAGLEAALDRVDAGDICWVSDAGLESYHSLWFELHEELLRALGNRRAD